MRPGFSGILALATAVGLCVATPTAAQEPDQGDNDSAAATETTSGAALFARRCAVCHSLADGKNGNGPSLYGIIDRPAATAPGFKYSRAMRRMAADESLAWSEENLAAFIGRPSRLVPGTRMAFPGLDDEAEVAALVEWIRANSGQPGGDG